MKYFLRVLGLFVFVIAVVMMLGSSRHERLGLLPQGDGCSGGMSGAWILLTGKEPAWQSCCDSHDVVYRGGGTSDQRMEADRAIYACVRDRGHPVMAWVMWLAVRVGGQPFMPFDWRWGFGRDYSSSWWYDQGGSRTP